MKLKICIYEDNQDLRETLRLLLNEEFEIVGTFSNCGNILSQITNLRPNVILMDIEMPGTNGIEGLKIVNAHFPDINVIMLTVFETNEHIFDAIRFGAVGYLLKKSSPSDIIKAIQEVNEGGTVMTPSIARKVLQFFPKDDLTSEEKVNDEKLTKREVEVLTLLTKGYTYKMSAIQLGISTETVRTHIKRIYTKLHVNSNIEAVTKAIYKKLV